MPLTTNFISRVWKSSVGWTFAVTALRAGGFILVLPIALRQLSPSELGLWYLFTAIGDLVAMAELGLGLIIGRCASFFMAGVEKLPVHGLTLDATPLEERVPNLAGLAGLLALARRVYVRIVACIVVLMLTFGLAIVSYKMRDVSGSAAEHYFAYFVFVAAIALSVAGTYWPNFLLGVGHVRLGQRAFLFGLLMNYSVAALCLHLGFGIISLAIGQLLLALANFIFARRQALACLPGLTTVTALVIQFGELWPSTWRSLLTAFGANMCCQATLFVCGIISSLATTASFGLSLKLALVAQGLAGAWLVVRQPHIGRARAAADRALAVELVKGSVPRCFFTYLAGAVAIFFLAPPLLEFMKSRTPILPAPLLAGMLVMVGLDFLVGFHSAVLLTANRFPHLWVYLASGVASVGLAFALGRIYGVAGIIAAPVLAQLVCAYWWVPARSWRELRAPAAAIPENPVPVP